MFFNFSKHWLSKQPKKNLLACLKVYIMLFPKHNSNTTAHQVILMSLKANCHYLFMQSISNFCILDESSNYGRFVFKFCSHYTDRRLSPSPSICGRNGTLLFYTWSFELWYTAEMLAIPDTNPSIASSETKISTPSVRYQWTRQLNRS